MPLPWRTERLLHVFFEQPWEEFHLRALARRAKIAPPTAHKHLAACVKEEWLLRRRVAQLTLFRPQWSADHLLNRFETFEINRRDIFFNRHKAFATQLRLMTETLLRTSAWQIQLILLVGAGSPWKRPQLHDGRLVILAAAPTALTQAAELQATLAVQKLPAQDKVIALPSTFLTLDEAVDGLRTRRTFYPQLWSDRIVLYNEFLFWRLVRAGLHQTRDAMHMPTSIASPTVPPRRSPPVPSYTSRPILQLLETTMASQEPPSLAEEDI